MAVDGIVYPVGELLPDTWRALASEGPVRTFNPGLLRDGDGWLFAYRVVAPDERRRIGICRLNHSLRIIAGSARPLSDTLRIRPDGGYAEVVTQWFADPRLYRFGNRLFVYWNSGWHEPRNHQFVQELDPRTLTPLSHARELVLKTGIRQNLEKNWTFFGEGQPGFFAVYSITPFRILASSIAGEEDLVFGEVSTHPLSIDAYPSHHGGLRGGSPPVLTDAGYTAFCHSVHDGPAGYRYAAAAYRFSATAPFGPTDRPRTTLRLHNPFGGQRTHPSLNPAVTEVLYPCGAARDGDRWLVSHGINDEYCAISVLSDADVDSTLEPVGAERSDR